MQYEFFVPKKQLKTDLNMETSIDFCVRVYVIPCS